MVLVTEGDLVVVNPPAPSIDNIDPVALADPETGPTLRTYLVLTQWPKSVRRAGMVARGCILEPLLLVSALLRNLRITVWTRCR